MAKRFTDTTKYKKPFMRTLPGAYKLLWDFLYHDCDHAGIWIVDFDIAQMYLGKDMPIRKDHAIVHFNSDEQRILEIDNGKKWFIPSFIDFQYGKLSENNRAHLNVIKVLSSFGLIDSKLNLILKNKPLTSPLQGAKEQEQDKEEEMEQEQEGVRGEFSSPVPFEESFKYAFDDMTLERFSMNFKGVNIIDELRLFRLKCDNDPATYHSRDPATLRTNFQYQLKNAKPQINGSKSFNNRKQQQTDSLIIAHAQRWGNKSVESS